MKEAEIISAQNLIDKMIIGEQRSLKEIYGDEWYAVHNPKDFGKKFKDAASTGALKNIKHIGIRNNGRCDEYQRV